MRTITLTELRDEMKAQGVEREHYAFVCVACGTVQTRQEFVEAGAAPTIEEAQRFWGFSCIGRFTRGKGCDWTLGGLLRIHTLEVVPEDGSEAFPCFEPATPEQAQAHANLQICRKAEKSVDGGTEKEHGPDTPPDEPAA